MNEMVKKENKSEESKKPALSLDPWQQEVLGYRGNKIICSGRQTGKSTVVAMDAAEFAIKNKSKQVLIISVTEDQAKELLQKVVIYIFDNYSAYVKKPHSKNVLKDIIRLNNGSVIRTKAVGQGGTSVRGFTIDRLIADEAAFMPEDVWPAVTPMLLTTGGDIVLISTPFGRKNFFYKCYHDTQFKVWHINTIETINSRQVSPTWSQFQRDKALEYFNSEKYRLTPKQFAQEYEGQFVDDLSQFFQDQYIKRVLIQQRVAIGRENLDFFLGVDIGRLGGDKTVFVILERRGELLIQREKIVWDEAYLDQIAKFIMDIDRTWNFRKIYLDNGGIGIGVYDILYNAMGFKKRVIGINNSEKIVEYNPDGTEKRKKFMKEETYANLLFLMMRGKILLFDDSDIWLSLKSAQFEYINQRGGAMMKISHPDHNQSHLAEAIVRAAMASREKINKFAISYI
ncbi:MAG: terminase family protein [Patescibacteria group bacterium]|mgnify:CR=1 FL=1